MFALYSDRYECNKVACNLTGTSIWSFQMTSFGAVLFFFFFFFFFIFIVCVGRWASFADLISLTALTRFDDFWFDLWFERFESDWRVIWFEIVKSPLPPPCIYYCYSRGVVCWVVYQVATDFCVCDWLWVFLYLDSGVGWCGHHVVTFDLTIGMSVCGGGHVVTFDLPIAMSVCADFGIGL